MNQKIYISPSDQDRNIYAVGNTNEAEQCRKIAGAMVRVLERCGFMAKTNVAAEMEDRVTESNAWGADLHICIHTNAYDGKVQGTRLFCYDTAGQGYQACQAVMAALAPITPGQSDGISARPELYEVRSANAITVYVEVGFHDNTQEAAWIVAHTSDIAEAITKGLCDYYGIAYVPENDGVYNTLDEVPGYAKATIGKLLDKDLLLGTPKGLELTEQMVRLLVINDRAGLYD